MEAKKMNGKKKKKKRIAVSHMSSSDTITQLHNNYSRKFTFLSGFEIIRI